MHSFLVAMDGGEWISEQYRFDIVDKRNATVINEDKALHEEFIDYLRKFSSRPSAPAGMRKCKPPQWFSTHLRTTRQPPP